MCVAEGLFSVQAYTDVSSIGRLRTAACPSPLVVSAPTAGWALGPGGPARPGTTHWYTHTTNSIYINYIFFFSNYILCKVFSLPGHGWMLQSWYSTGDPTQAFGLVLPSAIVQLRFLVRKPLEHCCEQLDHVSQDPQRAPWGWVRVRPLVFTKSSTRAGKINFIWFIKI